MAKKKKLDEEKKVVGSEPDETEEKSSGTLSEGVLDAFDENESPTGLEDEEKVVEDDEDDELGEMDFMTSDSW